MFWKSLKFWKRKTLKRALQATHNIKEAFNPLNKDWWDTDTEEKWLDGSKWKRDIYTKEVKEKEKG